jgi:uncharacterized protein (DUF1810 family)
VFIVAKTDPYNLKRFLDAQDEVFGQVCTELREGRKRTHWMWFIFPQLKGLGHSTTAEFYALSSLEEAEAYLSHPVLGARLRQCAELVNQIEGRTVDQIFGSPDNLKFRSCMTLFAQLESNNQVFKDALEKHFGGEADTRTLELLR